MEWARLPFIFVAIFLCITQSSALSDDELNYFKMGTSDEEFDDTGFYPSIIISNCSHYTRRAGTTYYHRIETNYVPWYDVSAMPDGYTTWSGSQLVMTEQSADRCIPMTGSFSDEPVTQDGLLGFLTNGAPIWHYNSSTDKNAVEFESFDTCGGHASPQGTYHVHGWDDWSEIADGCFPGFDVSTCPATIIGVALDGFPIYGPQNCPCVTTASDGSCSEWPSEPSGYVTAANGDLDGCNGRDVDASNPIQASDVGAQHIYEYRLTLDPPYHIGCLMGNKSSGKCSQTCYTLTSTAKRSDDAVEEMVMEEDGEHLEKLREILIAAAKERET